MGKRTENGFLVKTQNGDEVLISNHEARSIYDTLEHEYHLEDVRNELEERGIEVSRVTDKELEKICTDYEHNLNNDDNWTYLLDNAISNFSPMYKGSDIDDEPLDLTESDNLKR